MVGHLWRRVDPRLRNTQGSHCTLRDCVWAATGIDLRQIAHHSPVDESIRFWMLKGPSAMSGEYVCQRCWMRFPETTQATQGLLAWCCIWSAHESLIHKAAAPFLMIRSNISKFYRQPHRLRAHSHKGWHIPWNGPRPRGVVPGNIGYGRSL